MALKSVGIPNKAGTGGLKSGPYSRLAREKEGPVIIIRPLTHHFTQMKKKLKRVKWLLKRRKRCITSISVSSGTIVKTKFTLTLSYKNSQLR